MRAEEVDVTQEGGSAACDPGGQGAGLLLQGPGHIRNNPWLQHAEWGGVGQMGRGYRCPNIAGSVRSCNIRTLGPPPPLHPAGAPEYSAVGRRSP